MSSPNSLFFSFKFAIGNTHTRIKHWKIELKRKETVRKTNGRWKWKEDRDSSQWCLTLDRSIFDQLPRCKLLIAEGSSDLFHEAAFTQLLVIRGTFFSISSFSNFMFIFVGAIGQIKSRKVAPSRWCSSHVCTLLLVSYISYWELSHFYSNHLHLICLGTDSCPNRITQLRVQSSATSDDVHFGASAGGLATQPRQRTCDCQFDTVSLTYKTILICAPLATLSLS